MGNSEIIIKYIKDYRKDYKVYALFYNDNKENKDDYDSRLFADVVKIGFENLEVDAYILMMNPGSCKPSKKQNIPNYYSKYTSGGYKVVEAVSDQAQKYVMLLMDNCNFNKIRIINLSDFICPKSNDFYEMVSKSLSEFVNKSIFSSNRTSELNELIKDRSKPIFVCYGLNNLLFDLKKQAIERITELNLYIIGIPEKEENNYNYRYIKPVGVSIEKQKEIIKELVDKYNTYKS